MKCKLSVQSPCSGIQDISPVLLQHRWHLIQWCDIKCRLMQDAQRTAHISALFQMASSAGTKVNDMGHLTACTRMQ